MKRWDTLWFCNDREFLKQTGKWPQHNTADQWPLWQRRSSRLRRAGPLAEGWSEAISQPRPRPLPPVSKRLGWKDPHAGALGLAGSEARSPGAGLFRPASRPPARAPSASSQWSLGSVSASVLYGTNPESQLFLLLAALITSPPSSAEI